MRRSRARRSSRASGSKHVGSRPGVRSALPRRFTRVSRGTRPGRGQCTQHDKRRRCDGRRRVRRARAGFGTQGQTTAPAGGRRPDPRSEQHAPPDWRPPRGLRGLAGLRDDAPSEARGADGSRAGRTRGGRRSGGATSNKTPEPQQVPGLAAEDGGFEPPRACTQHAFQACAIGH